VFLPDGDAIECDVFLGTVRADRSIVKPLREDGFREISCGQRKRDYLNRTGGDGDNNSIGKQK
jgi:hypothetical protein